MPDYKELYLVLFRASEQAIRLLIEAQQRCEELYLGAFPEEPAAGPQAERQSPAPDRGEG